MSNSQLQGLFEKKIEKTNTLAFSARISMTKEKKVL
jgi:hypothetical protein